jgi:hypothetical protein
VAKALGGKRIGTLSGEDIMFEGPFSAEVKSRQTFVACNWMAQAVRNAKGKTPIVVVHIHGKRHDGDMVILRMEDFKPIWDLARGNKTLNSNPQVD